MDNVWNWIKTLATLLAELFLEVSRLKLNVQPIILGTFAELSLVKSLNP